MIVGYDHPHFGRFPADRVHRSMAVAGSPPSVPCPTPIWPPTWLVGSHPSARRGATSPTQSRCSSATNAHDERIHVIHNWAWEPVRLSLPRPMTDLLTDAGDLDQLDLGPWDVRVLAG